MEAVVRARLLAEFIKQIEHFPWPAEPTRSHAHLGGTLADAVLQAGLSYRSVVLPRVHRLIQLWPTSCDAAGFVCDLRLHGARQMLNWQDLEKPRRLVELAELVAASGVRTEEDLAQWLPESGRHAVTSIRGIGAKTFDYLMRLVGLQTVAVDRHVVRFVAAAGVECSGYDDTRRVVCFAADLLGAERGCLDQAIWRYMAGGGACVQSPPRQMTMFMSAGGNASRTAIRCGAGTQ